MPKIVACLIVKNEEALLSRCLDSIKGVDNIYIVDTGSIDKTIEIAKKYTDNVYTDFTWNDSFCDARNHVLSKVQEENAWILSIDADEFLHDFKELRAAVDVADTKGALAVDCYLYAEGDNQMHNFPRLFKKSDQVWWEGAVHNHLSVLPQKIGSVKITYGFSPAHNLDPNRAMRILKKEVDRTGNAREIFYLGREYYYRNMWDEAVVTFGQYVQKSKFLAEKADAFLLMAICYWRKGMGDDARDACVQAIICNPQFKEAVKFMATLAGKGSGNPTWEKNATWWEKAAENCDNTNVLFVRE